MCGGEFTAQLLTPSLLLPLPFLSPSPPLPLPFPFPSFPLPFDAWPLGFIDALLSSF